MTRDSRRPTLPGRTKRFLGKRTLAAAVALATVAGTFVPTSASAAQAQVAMDDFHRADRAGWGSAATGGDYSQTGGAEFSVQGNRAVIADIQPGRSAGAHLDGVSATDVLVASVAVVPADISSLRLYHTVEARRQDDGSAYRGRVQVGPGGTLSLGVSRLTPTDDESLGRLPLPSSVTAGQELDLHMRITGSDPVTVDVRAFGHGSTVPAWQLTVTDDGPARITEAGGVGVWDYVSRSAPAVSVIYTSFAASDLAAPTARAAVAARAASATAASNGYMATTFDGMPLGAVQPNAFVAALGETNTNASAYDDMTVVSDSRGGRFLRTTLEAGTIHSGPGPGDNGDNLFISLPEIVDRACVQYQIRFDRNFHWSLGGKLPGLLGVAPGTSPGAPTGGNQTDRGWSGRMMWLGPKAYSWAGPTNMAVSYLYHPGQADNYGDNIRWNKPFVAGTWHTVKQCYSMNTVGSANGILKAWLDGRQVVDLSNVTYRSRGDVHITHLSFALFRGGGTTDWAGRRTGHVDVDNVEITRN